MKINPLLVETILETIFDNLSLRDLRQCFSVCKLWSQEASRIKCKRQTVKIDGQEDWKTTLKKLDAKLLPKINKLEVRNLDLGDPLFKNFLLKIEPTLSELIINEARGTLQTLHELLLCVPNLIRLEIGVVKVVFGNVSVYHQLFPIYDRSTNPPQLVIFDKLESLEFLSFDDPATPISATLKTFPNLKSLMISNGRVEKCYHFNDIVMPFLTSLSMVNFPGHCFREDHINMLMQVKFPSLTSLKLSNLDVNLNMSRMKEFIESFKHTLLNLELRHHELNSQRILDTMASFKVFPLDLPNLNELHIDKPYIQNLQNLFISLPKLSSVSFNINKYSDWTKIIPKNVKENKHNIKSLSISNIQSKPLEMMSKYFSGVTQLLIHNCNDKILHAIYANMPLLELLICFDSENDTMTSEGFTGIEAKHFITNSKSSKESCSDNEDEVDVDYDSLRTMPYVGNLTRLKHAFLNFTRTACVGNILNHGFMDIASLKCVTIEGLELPLELLEYLEDCELNVLLYNSPRDENVPCAKIFFCDVQESINDFQQFGSKLADSDSA